MAGHYSTGRHNCTVKRRPVVDFRDLVNHTIVTDYFELYAANALSQVRQYGINESAVI